MLESFCRMYFIFAYLVQMVLALQCMRIGGYSVFIKSVGMTMLERLKTMFVALCGGHGRPPCVQRGPGRAVGGAVSRPLEGSVPQAPPRAQLSCRLQAGLGRGISGMPCFLPLCSRF